MSYQSQSWQHRIAHRLAKRAQHQAASGPISRDDILNSMRHDHVTPEQAKYNEAEARREEKTKHDR